MIQRIQTIYLILGVLLLVALTLIQPLWVGSAATGLMWFVPVVAVLVGLAAIVAIVAVFLYRNRKRQRSTVVLAQVVTFILLAVILAGTFMAGEMSVTVAGEIRVERVVMYMLPVLAYVSFILARRGIDKDIELIRSMDRLR